MQEAASLGTTRTAGQPTLPPQADESHSKISQCERDFLRAYQNTTATLEHLRRNAQDLVARYPNSVECRFLHAELAKAAGQGQLALAEFERLKQIVPQNQLPRVESQIRDCQPDREYFPSDFRRRFDADQYVSGLNAKVWREYALQDIQRARKLVSHLLQRTPLRGRKILDVGCGYGGLLIALAEQGADVTGIEIDSQRATIGRKRIADLGLSIDYRLDDLCRLGVEHDLGKFDVVVAQDVIEHVLDPAITIQALSNILNPGGLIYILVGNKFSPDQLLADHHYRLAGITMLARAQAREYFHLVQKNPKANYDIGYWRSEGYYRRMFGRFGVKLENTGNYSAPSNLSYYAQQFVHVCQRATQEIFPGLRPALQNRTRNRMLMLARYFSRMVNLIERQPQPELRAVLRDRLVKKICVPSWSFIGTKEKAGQAIK